MATSLFTLNPLCSPKIWEDLISYARTTSGTLIVPQRTVPKEGLHCRVPVVQSYGVCVRVVCLGVFVCGAYGVSRCVCVWCVGVCVVAANNYPGGTRFLGRYRCHAFLSLRTRAKVDMNDWCMACFDLTVPHTTEDDKKTRHIHTHDLHSKHRAVRRGVVRYRRMQPVERDCE